MCVFSDCLSLFTHSRRPRLHRFVYSAKLECALLSFEQLQFLKDGTTDKANMELN